MSAISLHRSFLVLVLATSACDVQVNVASGVQLSCDTSENCPTGFDCKLGRCIEPSAADTTPPAIVGFEVSPPVGKSGTTFSIIMTVDEDLATVQPAIVALGNAAYTPVADLTQTVPAERRYAFSYTATGEEPEGVAMWQALLMDRHGNVSETSIAAMTLDFSAPTASGFDWSFAEGTTAVGGGMTGLVGSTELGASIVSASVVDAAGVFIADVADRLSLSESTSTNLLEVSGDVDFRLLPLAGLSAVAVRLVLADSAGNISTPGAIDTPFASVDLVKPFLASISILGPPIRASLSVLVRVDAADATAVRLTGDIVDGGDWVVTTFPAELPATLTSGAGIKTVLAEFRDAAANVSDVAAAMVELDPSADATPASLVSATASRATDIVVEFSKPLSASAEEAPRYTVVPALEVQAAFLLTDGKTVLLQTAEQLPGQIYSMTIAAGISDTQGNLAGALNVDFVGYGTLDASTPTLTSPPNGGRLFIVQRSTPIDFAAFATTGYDPLDPTNYDVDDLPRLQWEPRSGTTSYTVALCRDEACLNPVAGSPFVVPASRNELRLTPAALSDNEVAGDLLEPLEPVAYYVKLTSNLSPPNAPTTSMFFAFEPAVRVYCPELDNSVPVSSCSDTDRVGNLGAPLRTIGGGLRLAAQLGLSHVYVAARGNAGSQQEAYQGAVVLKDGIYLRGGFAPDFSPTAPQPSAQPTLLQSLGSVGVAAFSLTKPTIIDGFYVQGGDAETSHALLAHDSGDNLTVRNSTFVGGVGREVYAARIVNSTDPSHGPTFVDSHFVAGTGSTYNYAIYFASSLQMQGGSVTSPGAMGIVAQPGSGALTLSRVDINAGSRDAISVMNATLDRLNAQGSVAFFDGFCTNSVIRCNNCNRAVWLKGQGVLSNNTIYADRGALAATGLETLGANVALFNNIFALAGTGTRTAIKQSASHPIAAIHNNLFVNLGSGTFYLFHGFGVSPLADLSWEGGGWTGGSGGALGNISWAGIAPFVDVVGGDFHLAENGLPAADWLNVRYGGLDTSGPTYGSVTFDMDGDAARTLGVSAGVDIGTNADAAGYGIGADEVD